jgi:hypothetical protein
MSRGLAAFLFLLGLFVGMALLLELGRRHGRAQLARAGTDVGSGLGPLEGAIFGLLGLLVAFTFSGAAARFDVRRQLIVQEANAVGTAYLRLDLLPPFSQPALRASFRDYLDARLRGYQALPDLALAKEGFAQAALVQGDIWRKAVAASRNEEGQSARLLLPALNEMFDVGISREVAAATHAPNIIFAMLGVLALVCSYLAGSAMAKSPSAGLVQSLAFPLIFVVTVYVILDLEYPRAGLIRIDAVDHVLFDVRKGMDAHD